MSYRIHPVSQRLAIPRPIDLVGVAPYLAISMRRLRNAYTGRMIRIRRDDDNVEMDIGQAGGGVLDRQAAKDFLGTSHAHMVEWVDQSLQETDLIQNTAAEQPSVALSGVILNNAGLNRALFFNSDMQVTQAGQLQPTTLVMCMSPVNHTSGAVVIGGGPSSSGYDFGQSASGTLPFVNAGASVNGTQSVATATRHLIAFRINGSSSTIKVDNNAEDTALVAGANTPLGITIGADELGANFADFYLHELFYFTSALSGANLDLLMSNMNAYYKVY